MTEKSVYANELNFYFGNVDRKLTIQNCQIKRQTFLMHTCICIVKTIKFMYGDCYMRFYKVFNSKVIYRVLIKILVRDCTKQFPVQVLIMFYLVDSMLEQVAKCTNFHNSNPIGSSSICVYVSTKNKTHFRIRTHPCSCQ